MDAIGYVDISLLNIDCVTSKDPVNNFLVVILSPIVAMSSGFCVIFFFKYVLGWRAYSFDGMLNVIGNIMLTLYIIFALAALQPFQCYSHPNGQSSMVSDVSVLCWDSASSHSILIILSVIAFAVYVAGVFAVVAYATWRYPMELSRCNVRFIRRTKCIFVEYSPRRYWFSSIILLRNLLLSVLPMVIPREKRSFTILLMALALQTVFVVEARFLPAKTKALNVTSLSLGQTLVMIYLVSLAVSDPSIVADETMSICAFVLSVGTATMITASFFIALLAQFQPVFAVKPFNHPFVIDLLKDDKPFGDLSMELRAHIPHERKAILGNQEVSNVPEAPILFHNGLANMSSSKNDVLETVSKRASDSTSSEDCTRVVDNTLMRAI